MGRIIVLDVELIKNVKLVESESKSVDCAGKSLRKIEDVVVHRTKIYLDVCELAGLIEGDNFGLLAAVSQEIPSITFAEAFSTLFNVGTLTATVFQLRGSIENAGAVGIAIVNEILGI